MSSGDDATESQDYCDWCYQQPLTADDRARSREAGLSEHLSLACTTCIDAGRIRNPPGGWKVGADWPLADI